MYYSHKSILALADGTIYQGTSIGALGVICGELVFNTAQTGYQEILTDPSYLGQIIVFTQPHIGNVGVNLADMESKRVYASGVVMHSLSRCTSNWRQEQSLAAFLKEEQVMVISDVDTRALTHQLRQFGSQSGCLMSEDVDDGQALEHARQWPGLIGQNLTSSVSTKDIYTWKPKNDPGPHLVVYDFGVKHSILDCLSTKGCHLTIVPATTTAKDILALKPDGIVLSNGPGDPAACHAIIETIKELLDDAIPIMGICLGHQLLALASGAQIEKMAFGHHGANHPIQCLATGVVNISSQNHGFVVSDKHLPSWLHVTHRSLFDGTIAGIKRMDVPAFGFQGHPEGGPGPTETSGLFDEFLSLVEVSHA